MAITAERISETEAQKIVEDVEQESRFRKIVGPTARLITVIALVMTAFHLYTAGFGLLAAVKQRAAHLGFVLTLSFLLYPASKGSPRSRPSPLDWLLAAASAGVLSYLVVMNDAMADRGGFLHQYEYAIGIAGILLLLEASRRVLGKELTIMGLIFLLYSYLGNYIPGPLGHRGYSVFRITEHMFFSAEGIFGIALGVSATYMFLFVLFGALLQATGLTQLINDLALAVAGRSPGGPAKVAVLTTGMMGMISGSAVANAASTGAVTIPMMKSVGYKPHFAAGVEGAGSTGGQIMPPVMGAGAFIMAEVINVPYGKIALAAAVPAILYYASIWIMVHLEAKKLGLKGLSREELPDVRKTIRERGHMFIPLAILLYLLFSGRTPLNASFWAVIATVLVGWLRPQTRMDLPGIIRSFEAGARGALGVAIACAIVGFVVGAASLTSLGLVASDVIIRLAGDNLFLALFLTMITSIIVGTGVPTTATYILVATVAAPVLLKMGMEPLAAHMFVFYYGALADVTPPTALSAYTAAALARCDPGKATWTALKLALSGFVVPYFFAVQPALLLGMKPVEPLTLAWSLVACALGVVALSLGLQGYVYRLASLAERAALLAASILLINPGALTDAIGLALFGAVLVWQRLGGSREVGTPAV